MDQDQGFPPAGDDVEGSIDPAGVEQEGFVE